MSVSLYELAMGTFVPMLRSLSGLLDKGARHASDRRRDPGELVEARLAPDMFPLAKQVQFACSSACLAVDRLAGRASPAFENDEASFDDLKARIAKTIEHLQGANEADFEGAEGREIKVPVGATRVLEMQGVRYLRDWALPHFYFHLVTAYDILRHHGVELGKADYVSQVADCLRERREGEVVLGPRAVRGACW